MKFHNVIEMAFMNIVAMKKNFVIMIVSFASIVITLLCFFSYRSSVSKKMEVLTASKASTCYLQLSLDVPNKRSYEQITSRYVRYEWPTGFSPNNIELIAEGVTFKGHDKKNYRFNVNQSTKQFVDDSNHQVPFNLCAVLKENDELFPEMILSEMRVDTGIITPIKYGSPELDKGKILISDFMLEQFGLADDEQKSLIGKSITIKNVSNNITYCNDLILCGVIDSHLYYVDSLAETNAAHILISEEDMCEAMVMDMEKFIRNEKGYFNDDYEKIDLDFSGNLYKFCYMRSFSDYKPLIKLLTDDGYTVWPSSNTEIYYVIRQQRLIIDNVVSVIIGVLAITLFFYLITAVYFYHKRNSRFKHMLIALGMNSKNVFEVSFTELLICSVVAIMIGIIASLGIICIFNEFWSNDSYVEIGLSWDSFVMVPIVSLLLFIAFAIIVAKITTHNFINHQLSSVLNEE